MAGYRATFTFAVTMLLIAHNGREFMRIYWPLQVMCDWLDCVLRMFNDAILTVFFCV